MLSVEVGSAFPDQPDIAEAVILDVWQDASKFWFPIDLHPPVWPEASSGRKVNAALSYWAQTSPRPLVVFIDEIDSLQNQTLISVLRQLRDGFPR
ncbi:hypothetical protein [Cylindrospermopsis raciborskii]|jgi:hypothetical protein|uniref:hypothetical protein n=1 Tax=Cylindrospermopsis raciborskii TaxID=77022 RepID=UPI001F29CB77|nr:hypothetical protein [Cylindrospermopsis raciborskii]UJS03390.1 hypothetical protein L3I90_09615 [Cylindrospermopsis raciborskii KLL07]